MAAVSFNTLKFANRLKEAGVSCGQAEAEAEAEILAEALEVNLKDLATKNDLAQLEARIEAKLEKELVSFKADVAKEFTVTRADAAKEFTSIRTDVVKEFTAVAKEFAAIKTDLAVAKWMFSLLLGGVIALVLKAFFLT